MLKFDNYQMYENYIGVCRGTVLNKYGKEDEGGFEKWEEDSKRFIEESFINSPMFPLIHDGKIELDEWVEGTSATAVFLDHWGLYTRLEKAKQVIKKMLDIYMKHDDEKHQHYVYKFSMVLATIEEEREND